MTRRIKYCEICKNDYEIMYRVQYKKLSEWEFLCKECLLTVKKNNPNYRYGGTWKK